MSPGSTSRTSTSVVTSAPSDAVRHYETLSKLHKQLAEVETVLAHERRERDIEADRMGQMLARLAERESRAEEAEKRAEAACARVATLEAELVTAQIVAAAIDAQLVATEDALERVSQPPPTDAESQALVEQMRERLDALTETLERMKDLVGSVAPK
jgi:chromosome segregation ATPase